jgi:hypothetical protein
MMLFLFLPADALLKAHVAPGKYDFLALLTGMFQPRYAFLM